MDASAFDDSTCFSADAFLERIIANDFVFTEEDQQVLASLPVDEVNNLMEKMALEAVWPPFPNLVRLLFLRNEAVKCSFIKMPKISSAMRDFQQKRNYGGAAVSPGHGQKVQLFSLKSKGAWVVHPTYEKIEAIVLFFEMSRQQRKPFIAEIVNSKDIMRVFSQCGDFQLLSRLLMVWLKMITNEVANARAQRLESLGQLVGSGIGLFEIAHHAEYVHTLPLYPTEVWTYWQNAMTSCAVASAYNGEQGGVENLTAPLCESQQDGFGNRRLFAANVLCSIGDGFLDYGGEDGSGEVVATDYPDLSMGYDDAVYISELDLAIPSDSPSASMQGNGLLSPEIVQGDNVDCGTDNASCDEHEVYDGRLTTTFDPVEALLQGGVHDGSSAPIFPVCRSGGGEWDGMGTASGHPAPEKTEVSGVVLGFVMFLSNRFDF